MNIFHFSYDDRSKTSTIKRNINIELMKLLSDCIIEIYHKETSTNNINGSIENDFNKELSRDSELNNLIHSNNFNDPLMKPGNILLVQLITLIIKIKMKIF